MSYRTAIQHINDFDVGRGGFEDVLVCLLPIWEAIDEGIIFEPWFNLALCVYRVLNNNRNVPVVVFLGDGGLSLYEKEMLLKNAKRNTAYGRICSYSLAPECGLYSFTNDIHLFGTGFIAVCPEEAFGNTSRRCGELYLLLISRHEVRVVPKYERTVAEVKKAIRRDEIQFPMEEYLTDTVYLYRDGKVFLVDTDSDKEVVL